MPFNPQASYRGDAWTMQGMGSIANSIGKMGDELKKQKEELKKREQEDKELSQFLKTISKDAPMDLTGMNVDQKRAMKDAWITNEAKKVNDSNLQSQAVERERKQWELENKRINAAALAGRQSAGGGWGGYGEGRQVQLPGDIMARPNPQQQGAPGIGQFMRDVGTMEGLPDATTLQGLAAANAPRKAPPNQMTQAVDEYGQPIQGLSVMGNTAYKKDEHGRWVPANQKDQSTYMGLDDQGRPIFATGDAAKNLTVSTQSKAQQREIELERSITEWAKVKSTLRPEDIGIRGVVGEKVFDEGLGQFVEGAADPIRAKNRTALKAAIEGTLRLVSGDSRFNIADRKAVEAILPSDGLWESHDNAISSISAIMAILSERNRRYAQRLGKDGIADMSPDELYQMYRDGAFDRDALKGLMETLHPEPL